MGCWSLRLHPRSHIRQRGRLRKTLLVALQWLFWGGVFRAFLFSCQWSSILIDLIACYIHFSWFLSRSIANLLLQLLTPTDSYHSSRKTWKKGVKKYKKNFFSKQTRQIGTIPQQGWRMHQKPFSGYAPDAVINRYFGLIFAVKISIFKSDIKNRFSRSRSLCSCREMV